MTRTTTTLDQELVRLRARAPAPDYLDRKRVLYESQVDRLSAALLPEVRNALEREASTDIAAEWLDEATQTLKGIAGGLPKDLELRPEFREAAERVRAGLSEQFFKDALQPSEEEIGIHADELAQNVLGNWFAILERAKREKPGKVLTLSANALPDGVPPNAVYAGTDAFAVAVNVVASKFAEFLDTLKKEGPVVELAPELYLMIGKDGMRLAASPQAAEAALVRPLDQPGRRGRVGNIGSPVPTRFLSVYRFMEPIINIAPERLGRPDAHAIPEFILDEQIEQQIALAAAYAATAQPDADVYGAGPAEPESETVELQLDAPKTEISIDLAEYTMLGIDQAINPSPFWAVGPHYRRWKVTRKLGKELGVTITDATLSPLCRTSVAAVGYAVSGATLARAAAGYDLAATKALIEPNAEFRETFRISVNAAKRAIAMPESAAIAVRMRKNIETHAGVNWLDIDLDL